MVTEDHLKLLKRLQFEWDYEMYAGAPRVDIKRPYGNSDPIGYDVPMILGIHTTGNERGAFGVDSLTRGQVHRCTKVHEEMHIILQILVYNAGIVEGLYVADDHRNNWRLKLPFRSTQKGTQ